MKACKIYLVVLVLAVMTFSGCKFSVQTKNYVPKKSSDEKLTKDRIKTKEPIVFKMAAALEQDGVTVQNTSVFTKLNELVEKNSDLGYEEDITIFSTNIFFEKKENDSALKNYMLAFLIVNRYGEPLKNFEINYDFFVKDKKIMDNVFVDVDEANYGEIPNNTAMAFFIAIDQENLELVMNADSTDLRIDLKSLK